MKFSAAHRKALSDAHKGYRMPLSQRRAIAKAIKGTKRSESFRQKMRQIALNRKRTKKWYDSICEANAKKRGTTWKMSPDGRAKISRARKGMRFSKGHRRKLALAQTGKYGPESSRWVSDRSLVRIRYRYNVEFTEAQKRAILKRDGHKCLHCGSSKKLQADHKKAVALGGGRHLSNGQTLCFDCHWTKTRRDWKKIRRYQRGQKPGLGR